ncbi:MAG: sigma-70 family RNA polymerase sigma factor [Deltaproteobacteria bacterium]|nr:sigma-70 family RNA polymerase sigma factor [Deltaproteobacteria bacterium]MCB9786277.1 sigma-70 family RNA polymerase sigma factor [Deltaproteobacteria bacterium]
MLLDETEPLDSRILRLAQAGQRKEACRLLVEAYGAEILGTCINRMGSPAGGEDAAQDTMARALVALENYRGTAGLRPWLHRIAANRCIDLLRSRRSRLIRVAEQVEVDHVAAPERPMPVEVAESQAARGRALAAVRDALSVIKEPDRTWVELHYTHGLSYDEIAAEADISRAAVKQRIWRAVKRVRAELGDLEENAP